MTCFPFNVWSDEGGNSLIEMALIAPIAATMIVGTIDISRAVSTKLALEQAAQRTIELVQRSEYTAGNNSILQADAQTAAGLGSTATVVSWLECNHDGVHLDFDTGSCRAETEPFARYVQVTVEKSFTPVFSTRFFSGANSNGTVTLRATAGVRSV
jgi:Flp pilus assembly protein TadG